MALNPDKNLKIYFSIGEVAQTLGVNTSLLRYWETEFPQIKPRKGGKKGGIRMYSEENVRTIKLIYSLLKEKGMTIEGVRKRLRSGSDRQDREFEIASRLKAVKEELLSIKKELDDLPTI